MTRSLARGLWMGLAALIAGAAVATDARAATACADAVDPAVCERLDLILTELQAPATARDVRITGVNYPPGGADIRTSGELPVSDGRLGAGVDMDGEAITSAKVRLSDGDRARLEDIRRVLGWTVGILIAFLFALTFWRTFGREETL